MNKIVLGFPGVGKSYLAERCQEVSDSDSSRFHGEGWVSTYVDHLVQEAQAKPVVLGSTHSEVREEIQRRDCTYYMVYPQGILKHEYLERYRLRGSPESFISMMDAKWDEFINSCVNDFYAIPTVLASGMWLSDVVHPLGS